MSSERLRSLLLLCLAALTVWFAQVLRKDWGLDFSGGSLREWVGGFGWKAPAVYAAVLAFRPFLLLPSLLLLPVGGACFGVIGGTLLGGAGIAVAALIQFGLAHGIGGAAVRRWFGASLARVRSTIEAAGPLVVGLVTAHPTGPMTAFHWGAALAAMALLPFAVAVLAGGLSRAFLYSFFGASLVEPGSSRVYVSFLLLVAVSLLPIAHPGFRRRLGL